MTSSWSRITDSSSRSIVQVCWCFSIVLFQRKSEGSMQCGEICVPVPQTEQLFVLGNLISHLLSPGLCRMLLSPRTGGLALRQPLICQSRTAGRRTEEQNSSHDAQFVSHYLPVDCVEMCFCFLLPSRGSSPTCTSCSVGCVCGNCSISAGWMFSPPRMISSFRRPSQCSSNTDCSDCLC